MQQRYREVHQRGIEHGEFNEVDIRAVVAAIDDLIAGAHTKQIYLGQDARRETFAFIEQ